MWVSESCTSESLGGVSLSCHCEQEIILVVTVNKEIKGQ